MTTEDMKLDIAFAGAVVPTQWQWRLELSFVPHITRMEWKPVCKRLEAVDKYGL